MKTGNGARLFLGMMASGWAAGGVCLQRRLLDSVGGEGGQGVLSLNPCHCYLFPSTISQWLAWSAALGFQLRSYSVRVYSWIRMITPKPGLTNQDLPS